MRPIFYGQVNNGKLTLNNIERFQDYLKSISGEVRLTIGRYYPERTTEQNKYYWGVVLKVISDETGYTPDEIHEIMKYKFLRKELEHKGQKYAYVRSTTALDTKEMTDYIEQIRDYWATQGIYIPDANEVEVN